MNSISGTIETTAPATAGSKDWTALVGRMGLALIFVLSGLTKLTSMEGTMGYIGSVGLPFPAVAFAAAVVIEIAGGIALVVGFRLRAVATLLAVFSLITAFAFHANLADQNQFIHFLKNIAMAGGLLQVVAFGGGQLVAGRK